MTRQQRIEYLGRALRMAGNSVVEWAVGGSLSVLLLAAAHWLWTH